jgi:hypothetical protein
MHDNYCQTLATISICQRSKIATLNNFSEPLSLIDAFKSARGYVAYGAPAGKKEKQDGG